ncbi:hypothetical protein MPL1_01553 [Methylophaga lonarensis MPL]|uniref:Uncharacterized protein n=1 Tax=Methylophaga lonarensis MPL TaxID=1286106 RepID=M7P3K2_9GAMM|nr:CopG family antitoxin [Methylophaga lonarensis]EMR14092.1 hypothetical protein MPL1_01553 [Methylophaga lonarensis MPL]
MKESKEHSKFDDYELKDEYDFSSGVRARFYKSKKVSTTLRLDDDLLIFLKKKASEQHIGYQTLINSLLRKQLEMDLQQTNTKID